MSMSDWFSIRCIVTILYLFRKHQSLGLHRLLEVPQRALEQLSSGQTDLGDRKVMSLALSSYQL